MAGETVIDERDHVDAFVALLSAALAHGFTAPDDDPEQLPPAAYPIDKIPDELPPIYVEVQVARRLGALPWPGGGTGPRGWHLYTRAVGLTYREAAWARARVAAAVENKAITIVAGHPPTTRVRFETEQTIDPDDGYHSGTTDWTYAGC